MPKLRKSGVVWVLELGGGENRFRPTFLDALEQYLDLIESGVDQTALVTIGLDRFFSNGLDLAWVENHPTQEIAYVERIHRLLARVLTLPVPTVAAVNGHAFGAGAMLALAHDYRIMREDRGYFCFPEVDIHLPFTTGMAALIQSKLTPRAAIVAMATGRRYDGACALSAGLVDALAPRSGLEGAALAEGVALHRTSGPTLGAIKATMFSGAVAALNAPIT
jgi:enoyl-CoA hydratase/carnithine racemase